MSQDIFNKKNVRLKASAYKPNQHRAARMAVLHLCGRLNYGDPARETVSLAVLMHRLGWRSILVSGGGSLVKEVERAAVSHVRMPLDRQGLFVNWENRARLKALVQREKPVLVHAHGMDAVDMGSRMGLLYHLPLVVDLTQPFPDTARTRRLITRMSQASCTIRVPSCMMAAYLTQTFQINPAVIQCVPPGIDLQAYNTAAITLERLQALSHLWRLPELATVVLVAMPLEPGMGHEVFLDAMALADAPLYAVVIGSDEKAPGFRKEMEKKAEKLGLNGKVIMFDSCPDWPAAFWLSNVVAAANTVPTGQNKELLEAQALGRPVIVSDIGANAEMVSQDETALMVPPGNTQALAEALKIAAHMGTNQRVSVAEDARFFVEENFPQATWFNGVMDLYESLLYPGAFRQEDASLLARSA
ncbi:MAG: glycosyltransferase [Alphaproteobacteria bacterium]|nr:glycosyltransferase [Alphaproteobacteria bacterium]